jgi:hypothetical protein
MLGKTKNPRPPNMSKVPKTSNPNLREHLGREREERVWEGYPDPWEKPPEKEGRPERGLRWPEEQRTAATAADLGWGGG